MLIATIKKSVVLSSTNDVSDWLSRQASNVESPLRLFDQKRLNDG